MTYLSSTVKINQYESNNSPVKSITSSGSSLSKANASRFL